MEPGWCDRKGMRGRAPHKIKADPAAGWICLDPIAVELFAEADVQDAGHDRVDPVLRMRHQFCAAGPPHPDDVRAGLVGVLRPFHLVPSALLPIVWALRRRPG